MRFPVLLVPRAERLVFLLAVVLTACPQVAQMCQERVEPPRPRTEGTAMTVVRPTECRMAPAAGSPAQESLAAGASVRSIWAAEGFYYVQASGAMPCWVDGASVAPPQASGSRGLPLLLTPILVAAGEYIIKGAARWLQGGAPNPACGVVSVLQEEGERALVRTADGATGWVASAALAALSSVEAPGTSGTIADLQEGGAIPPADAGGLTVEVQVLRPDGRPIAPSDVLHLGDQYDLAVRCSRDCYVRITAEQPENDAVCQYHPNHLDGFARSARLAAGRWSREELLPNGIHFQVKEPIGEYDLIRVEANTTAPYSYVSGGDRGEGCQGTTNFHDGALTGCSRGGGFSDAPPCGEAASRGLVRQPQAAAVAQWRLATAR